MKTSNNTNQVGGTHYQFEIEPVHLMVKYNLNWFQGEILKYVSRHTNTNGKQDLEKALHICDMAKTNHYFKNIFIRERRRIL